MIVSIREYKKSDYRMLDDWWKAQDEIGPKESAIPASSSFILEDGGLPVLAVTLYLTNGDFCHVDNFVGNPKVADKKEYTHLLLNYISKVAKDQGYERLFCMGYKDKLKKYYESIGFNKTLDGVSTYTKEI